LVYLLCTPPRHHDKARGRRTPLRDPFWKRLEARPRWGIIAPPSPSARRPAVRPGPQLQREKEQSAAAGEFGPLFDRLADDDAPAPEVPSLPPFWWPRFPLFPLLLLFPPFFLNQWNIRKQRNIFIFATCHPRRPNIFEPFSDSPAWALIFATDSFVPPALTLTLTLTPNRTTLFFSLENKSLLDCCWGHFLRSAEAPSSSSSMHIFPRPAKGTSWMRWNQEMKQKHRWGRGVSAPTLLLCPKATRKPAGTGNAPPHQ